MYQVEYSKQSIRALMRMPANQAALVRAKVDELAHDPAQARNVKKLTGRPGFRLRVGDWRVLYLLDGTRLLVIVTEVGARGGIYE